MRIGIFEPSQRTALVDLLIELGRHYDAPGNPTAEEVAAHLDGSLTGPTSPVTLVTAEEQEGRVVGIVALVVMPSIVEPVGVGRLQAQLKELFVSASHRGTGVGEALLRWSARYALERGCGRLDWNVKAGNAAGIRFYERHGAQVVGDRLSYRISGDELSALARPGSTSPEVQRRGRTRFATDSSQVAERRR
jgi:ribosomal protein S18 acetylase RimI-like enzyme